MDAIDFYNVRVKKAKDFGFPDPIVINAEKLTNKTRVLYIAEIQATLIPDKEKQLTHHYSLRFSKFRKTKEEPFWQEEDIATESGFAINDRSSIEKLVNYIKANEALLDINILSSSYTSALLTNQADSLSLIARVLASEGKEKFFELLKDEYPDLDKKILTYKLVQARRVALQEFRDSLEDLTKKERSYWQPFLEKNRWMFGLSYFVLLDDRRIDLKNTADYLLESEDGFIDIVEIKDPHTPFWQKDSRGEYKKYRDFIQHSEELKGGITQATNYIFQVEKKFSDPDWCRSNGCDTPVKPKCTIILGRSAGWTLEEKTAFRLLNDSLHGIEVITFDHLYSRAQKLLTTLEEEE